MSTHMKCKFGKLLWFLSLAFLVAAWYSLFSKVAVAGLDPLAWFWSSLVLGVLCIPIKLDGHSCEVCNMK